jgi:hypothetical protein
MMRFLFFLAPVLLHCAPVVLSTAETPPATDPRAILQWAIKAHGGHAALAKARISREQYRGTIEVPGTRATVTSDTVARLPNQFRSTITTELRGQKVQVIQVFDGTRGWLSEGGTVRPADKTTLAGWKELAHAAYCAQLIPLLAADKGYQLTALGESDLDGRKVFGLKVSYKGRRDVRLFFDRKTGLLVKKSYQPHEGGKEALRDEVYRDFKEFGGLKRHTRTTVLLNGTPHAELELVSVKVLDRVDDKEFGRP